MSSRSHLEHLWRIGISAVEGRVSVAKALEEHAVPQPDIIIAVGKTTGAMMLGAYDRFGAAVPGLVVTKYDHTPSGLPRGCEVIEAAHPIPDANSLVGGLAVQNAIAGIETGQEVLCLISGGASALVEVPEDGMSLAQLQALNAASIAQGLTIGQINSGRIDISQIKGGKVFSTLPACKLTVLSLSDVEGDSLGVVGSGLFDCHSTFVPAQVMAQSYMAGSNQIARDRIAAEVEGVQINAETLYRDIFDAADMIAQTVLEGAPGLYIFGGEPTVMLPEEPGKGGRNQSLAVAISVRLSGQDGLVGLVAGTDGSDGPTDAAGGFVATDGIDVDAAERALNSANCYPYLAGRGDLFAPGPTGTNVMDVILIVKS